MKRSEFAALLQKKIVILDGATGTELVKAGLPRGVCPELWIYEHPEAIGNLHRSYRDAGSDIVYTPTFGANRFKLEEFGLESRLYELNTTLASRAKTDTDAFVFGDLAPTGKFIEPFGDVTFERAVEVYREQVCALIDGGVDGFVIETMIDIQETRAAIFAVRSQCDLPVMVSVTFEDDGRTLNGSDALAALVIAQSLDIDAFGCNCSAGPEKMAQWIARMAPAAKVPLLAKPNAGLPKLVDGKTVFDMSADEFSEKSLLLYKSGASIIGGCCGTTPDHIRRASEKMKNCKPKALPSSSFVLANNRDAIVIDSSLPPMAIGGSEKNAGVSALEAIDSAQLKSICVARNIFPILNTKPENSLMQKFPGTLMIRSEFPPDEEILRNGHKAVINYTAQIKITSGAVYDLTEYVRSAPPQDISVCLKSISGAEALALCDFSALQQVEAFLLPDMVYDGLRLYRGGDERSHHLALSAYALSGNDPSLAHLIAGLSENSEIRNDALAKSAAERIFECVLTGNTELITKEIESALAEGVLPKSIVDDSMIPAINLVGEKYEKKIYFLPQLMLAAEAMQKGFARLEPLLSTGSHSNEGTIVLATVKGDIHDIGKNIVALMLRNYSFKVIDLGKDVDEDTIVTCAQKEKADIIALSALMTTTMIEMKKVIVRIRNADLKMPVMIGGAVVTEGYAKEIGAHYSRDAMEAVRSAQMLMKGSGDSV